MVRRAEPSSSSSPDPMAGRPARIRIVIADDHPMLLQGLRQVLEDEPGCEVVAEAVDVESTRRLVRGHRPDVLVLDLNMPGGPSIEAIPAILADSPTTKIVVLTMQDQPAYARQALSCGALGYVLKETAGVELVRAIKAVATGERYLSPRMGARVAIDGPTGPPGGMSEREAEVLSMIALGRTNPQIAEDMYLSVRTVEKHRAHIQQKLSLSDRSELVRYALDNGLLDPAVERSPHA
jgi:two-component system response regulator NreC